MKKRVLSALLALCLTLSLASTALAADDLQSATPSGSAAVQITDDEGGNVNPQTSVTETKEPENTDANPTAPSDAETEPETKPEDGEELDTEPVEDTDGSTDSIESSDASGSSTPAEEGTQDKGVEEATPAPQPLRVAPNNVSALADDGIDLGELLIDKTVKVSGNEGFKSGFTGRSPHEWTWSSADGGKIYISGSGNVITVEGVAVGTVILTHKYYNDGKFDWRDGWNYSDPKTETFIITVTDKVRVYVYVASKVTDEDGNLVQPELSWADNPDFLRLLGLSEDTVDNNKYFPVGEIKVDYKVFENQQSPYLKDDSDWGAVKEALAQLDTSTLQGVFAQNTGNKVSDYTDQIITDMGASSGSQKSALFDWSGSSNGFSDDSVKYHLDLRFNTNTITFITGNNGITSAEDPDAADGTVVEHRVYISGSQIQNPSAMPIPAGYKFDGYFEDEDFNTPWDGIGSSLNNDLTIYIRISPKDNVLIHYYNASGAQTGSVTTDSENFNPDTGSPNGSTAEPAPGYRFDGWYSDPDCKSENKVSNQAIFVPAEPETGWQEGQTFDYYAKFVPDIADVTITKTFEGLPTEELIAQAARDITFTVTANDPTEANKDFTVSTLVKSEERPDVYTATIKGLTIDKEYTIKEAVSSDPDKYSYMGNEISFNGESIAGGKFTVTGDNDTLAVTNKYERQKGNLKIQKEVKDGKGVSINTDEPFTFTIQADAALINEVYGEDKEFTVTSDTQQSMAPLTFDEKGKDGSHDSR